MATTPLVIVIVFAVLIVAGLAGAILTPHRLRHRKPLETHPDDIADPLPLSTVRKR